MVKKDQGLLQTKPARIYSLYDNYAGMLLGYIFEIVKDRKLAEDYLAKIFSSAAKNFDPSEWKETNTWCLLQRLAKSELSGFIDTVEDCDTTYNLPNKYLEQMTEEQKHIFCNVYYHNKTTAALSKELNKPEELIKKLLKEAFAVIRRSHDN